MAEVEVEVWLELDLGQHLTLMSFELRRRIDLLRLIEPLGGLACWDGKLGYHLGIGLLGEFVRGIYQLINVEGMDLNLNLILLMRVTLLKIESIERVILVHYLLA